MWVSFERIYRLFIQKIVIWVRDPGSVIRDPGSRDKKAPDPESRIRIRNTACTYLQF
jgi:hypothetical protein